MATPASIFPRRKTCSWEDMGGGLSANLCDDGSVFMYKDAATGESWFGTEKPPKKWRRHLQHNFGAAEAGVCPPHPTIAPHPSSRIVRLQKALNSLARRTGNHALGVVADGLVGRHTVKAVNHAMYAYAKGAAPSEFTTGALTHAQIVSFSPQLAAYIERSPIAASTRVAPTTSPSLPTPPPYAPPASSPPISPPAQAPVQYPSGANMYPYDQQPGYYYPQPAYYSNRAPGGLPADQATVDVKAFIPAQYEHVQVDPMTVAAAIILGVGIYIVATKKKTRSKED